MQTIKVISKTENCKTLVWCTTNDRTKLFEFIQYVLDDLHNPKDFVLWDTRNKVSCNLYDFATNKYEMRKRTFEERMNDVATGTWKIEEG